MAYASVPSSEFLETFLMVPCIVRQLSTGGAEGAGRSGRRDQGWHSIDGVGAAGSEAADGIRSEEGGGLRPRCDAQD